MCQHLPREEPALPPGRGLLGHPLGCTLHPQEASVTVPWRGRCHPLPPMCSLPGVVLLPKRPPPSRTTVQATSKPGTLEERLTGNTG